jgi:hypothetical protein
MLRDVDPLSPRAKVPGFVQLLLEWDGAARSRGDSASHPVGTITLPAGSRFDLEEAIGCFEVKEEDRLPPSTCSDALGLTRQRIEQRGLLGGGRQSR